MDLQRPVGSGVLDVGDEAFGGAGQGVEDIPALFLSGGDDSAQDGEIVGVVPGSKPPEIFWRSFIMRRSRSASLLVNGTSGSARNRKVRPCSDAG